MDPGIFVGGGGGGGGFQAQLTEKTSDVLFFSPQLILQRGPMVYFKENYDFLRFQRGSNIFQRRSNFSSGGSVC